MTTREKIADCLEGALFLDPPDYDEAIIGITERADGVSVVAYDRQRVIEVLMRMSDGMTLDEAEEYYYFNTVGSWVGDMTPVFVDTRFAE